MEKMQIERHSRQLIEDITNRLDKNIENFFNKYIRNIKKDKEIIFKDIVEEVLDEYYPNTDSLSIRDIADKLQKRFTKTKARWYKSFNNNIETYKDYTSKDSVFFPLYEKSQILKKSEWSSLYGNISFEELVISYRIKVVEWKNERKSMLIDYPLIDNKRPAYILSAYKLDIALRIYDIIKKEYGGSLDRFFRLYPQELIDKPLFSPSSYNMVLNEYGGQLINDFFVEEGTPQLRTIAREVDANKSQHVLKSLSVDDLTILSTCLTHIDTDFYATKRIVIPLSDIAKVLYSSKNTPSGKHYEAAAQRCIALGDRTFKYYDKKNKGGFSFSLFDHVVVSPSGPNEKRTVTIAFGELLYNAITNQKLIQVTAKNYDSLENPLSKIIYYSLQRERVNLGIDCHRQKNLNSALTMTKKYSYSFWQQTVRFYSTRKKKNFDLVNEALEEFIRNRIAIEKYNFNNGIWEITFLPLTKEEYDDLSFTSKYINISSNS